jgi:hypothetical protein
MSDFLVTAHHMQLYKSRVGCFKKIRPFKINFLIFVGGQNRGFV